MARHYAVIQALRAVAAIGVVAAHLTNFEGKYMAGPTVTPQVLDIGMLGVDLFFVISGFIITTVSVDQFGRPGAWRRFAANRFIRIYPIYWFYFLLLLPLFLLRPEMVNGSHGTPNLLTSFLLLPDDEFPLLLVAWTLVYEVLFYAVFTVLLAALPRRRLPLALGLWATVLVTGNLILGPEIEHAWLHVIFHPLITEFLAGCVVALTVARLGRGASLGCAAAGLAVLVPGAALWSATGTPLPELWVRVLVFGTASALLVAGAVGLERSGGLAVPRVLVRLGDASYSLYLSHLLTIAAFGLVCRRLLDAPEAAAHVAAVLAAFGVALTGGWLSYRLVEAPMLGWLRGLGRPALPKPATA